MRYVFYIRIILIEYKFLSFNSIVYSSKIHNISDFQNSYYFLHSVSDRRLPEYCQTETFKAECAYGEVIEMGAARYGRMALGRCVRTDFGFLGCAKDVLSPMDKKCSGRRTCHVRIPDAVLDTYQPCQGDLTRYLEAEYHCVRGMRNIL